MAAPIDVKALPRGTPVEDVMLVQDVTHRTQQNGDPFTILILGNANGQVPTSPFWLDKQDMVAGIEKGQVVQISGEMGRYRDRPQLIVNSLRLLPQESIDLTALIPSVGGIDRYWERLDTWRAEITKPRLKAVIDLFYEDDAFRARYEQCPASLKGHHSLLGGLLQHTTEVAAIARAITRTSGGDQDLVLAGVLLHDIGKLDSYRWDGGIFEFTTNGRLLGHVTLGTLLVDRTIRAQPEPPCTSEEQTLIMHLILSHHGKLEFGSPVTPMTLEAEILHWADNASAKSRSMADALNDPTLFRDSPFSETVWQLDRRRVFKNDCDWGETGEKR